MTNTSEKPAKPRKGAKRNLVSPVSLDALANEQLQLFQQLLANTEAAKGGLSNAIDLWDNIPRYSVSRLRMNELRTAEGFLEDLEIPFRYRGREFVAIVSPARVKDKDGVSTSYYPSAREELIEHALRKIATDQQAGFFDRPNYRSGVLFSLHMLRRELEAQGHSLRFDEIIESLDILVRSAITIVAQSDDGEGDEAFATSTYFAALSGVRRKDYDSDRTVRWAAQFHPLVTRAIDRVTYRQFNYQRLMKCRSQLARWLLGQLVLKYTQASLGNSFEMRYTTIKRDSALLEGYGRKRDAVAALDLAFEELKELRALAIYKRAEERGLRSKLEEVIYTLYPSTEFAKEQKAANFRQGQGKGEARRLSDKSSPTSTGQGE